jgi:4'-phosphopantetheinyl transferase EntD
MTMQDMAQAMTAALKSLGPPGVVIRHRVISTGDEDALLPSETHTLRTSALKVRRQSGSVRIVARQLLSTLGVHDAALPRTESGAPLWPPGFVGSLAHDASIAVAAAASAERYIALGIDIEPDEKLPPELVDVVTTLTEREQYSANILQSRLLFAIKEAVFKATNPLDGVFLDFQDIMVDLNANQAFIRSGRKIKFAVCNVPCVVALAYIERET